MLIDLLGGFSAFCFMVCAFPQAYKSYKDGITIGISDSFLVLWFLGELGFIGYTLSKFGVDWPLLLNYLGNLIALLIIMRYRYFPRRSYFYERRERKI